jgi:membrane protein required for colicin V production
VTLPAINLLDIVLVIVVAASVVAGFLAGFARVGIGFIAAVSGLLFGFWFYGIPAAWLHRYIHSLTISNLLGFFLVFWGFLAVGSLLVKLLARLFKWTGLNWLDRLMGGAFGFVRGGLIAIAFIAVLLAFTPKPLPNWMVDSQVLPYAIDASNLCAALAPKAIKDAFRESMLDIRKAWEDQLKKKPKKKESDLKKVDS